MRNLRNRIAAILAALILQVSAYSADAQINADALRILEDVQRKLNQPDMTAGADAIFGRVEFDGSNLREVLIESPMIERVIPLGPKATYARSVSPVYEPDGSTRKRSAAMHDEVKRAIVNLCPTSWQVAVPVHASILYPGEVTGHEWKDIGDHKLRANPNLIYARYFNRVSGYGFGATIERYPITGARCAGVFDFLPIISTGSSEMHIVVEREFIVFHDVPQKDDVKMVGPIFGPRNAGDPEMVNAIFRAKQFAVPFGGNSQIKKRSEP